MHVDSRLNLIGGEVESSSHHPHILSISPSLQPWDAGSRGIPHLPSPMSRRLLSAQAGAPSRRRGRPTRFHRAPGSSPPVDGVDDNEASRIVKAPPDPRTVAASRDALALFPDAVCHGTSLGLKVGPCSLSQREDDGVDDEKHLFDASGRHRPSQHRPRCTATCTANWTGGVVPDARGFARAVLFPSNPPLLTCPLGRLKPTRPVRPTFENKEERAESRHFRAFSWVGRRVGTGCCEARRAALVGGPSFPQSGGSAFSGLSIIGMAVWGKQERVPRGPREGGGDPRCRHGAVVWTSCRPFHQEKISTGCLSHRRLCPSIVEMRAREARSVLPHGREFAVQTLSAAGSSKPDTRCGSREGNSMAACETRRFPIHVCICFIFRRRRGLEPLLEPAAWRQGDHPIRAEDDPRPGLPWRACRNGTMMKR
ncbi:hypothetical protein B0T11DRAFT_117741 [Plectosphaerella cucumerina]|uniref:Uncharacterized protein n=1 Tax=Plectosphaerella cucumerina TaxID=40658 RepID=A0A8K0X0P9_9PEZI|nr:hypothetical protein B0T11DRAFT_117741 [Plectosphaerella cucumerina]